MLDEIREDNFGTTTLFKAVFGLFLLLGMIVPAFGQNAENTQTATNQIADKKSETTILMPVLIDYKGIKIGTTADEVRDKLSRTASKSPVILFPIKTSNVLIVLQFFCSLSINT